MKYLFILNPQAGLKLRERSLVDLIDQYMCNSEHSYEFAYTTCAGDATRIAAQAVSEGFEIVVAVGGDGTVNEVGCGLIRTQGILGVLPVGSGNGVARSLKIPLTLKESIKLLISPEIITIDIGKVNEDYFIGVCGIGFDALIGRKFQEFGFRGPIPYFLIGIKEFMKYRPQDYLLKIDKETTNKKALFMAIANTKEYGNSAIIAPNADPIDGFLDVCLIEPPSIFEAIRSAFLLFRGKINHSLIYSHNRCKSVKISAKGEGISLHRDGEPDEITYNLDIKIEEKALKVCSPYNLPD